MLTLSFFVIALLYASVGFGGGSSYLAMLAASGVSYDLIPKLGLFCNLLVVSGGCWHYYRRGHFNKKLILPLVLSSMPLALLGGMYPISEKSFLLLLTATLILAGIRLLFTQTVEQHETRLPSMFISLMAGGIFGLLSGLVGIGGGIFLAPLMLNLRWAKPKEVATAASVFIWLNSIAGLVGQMSKEFAPEEFISFWPLFLAVLIGGQIGSRLGSHPRISQSLIQKGTAVLILLIAGRLLVKIVAT